MALVPCKNCGGTVSDKAKACPKCGAPVELPSEEAASPNICKECGTEIPSGADTCPQCGCPVEADEAQPVQKVEVTNVNLKVKSRTKKIIAVFCVVAVAAVAIFAGVRASNEQKAIEAYQTDTNLITAGMLAGAIQAEDVISLVHDVWSNAIYEERDSTTDPYTRPDGYFVDDFNEALANLLSDEDHISNVQDVQETQDLVTDYMHMLSDPPEEYEETYEAIKDCYDAFLQLTNLAINPTGSLSSYTENYNSSSNDFINAYTSLEAYAVEPEE